jgi:hypothetical protein
MAATMESTLSANSQATNKPAVIVSTDTNTRHFLTSALAEGGYTVMVADSTSLITMAVQVDPALIIGIHIATATRWRPSIQWVSTAGVLPLELERAST